MRGTIAALCLLLLAVPASAQESAPLTSEQLNQQLQTLLKSKDAQQSLQQGIALASLMGCASKQAGRQQTDAFYQQMTTVGEQVGELCQNGQKAKARTLVLQTMKANRYHQVVMAGNNCYAMQKQQLAAMAGPELAGDMANYNRWLRDPRAAQREMREEDICK